MTGKFKLSVFRAGGLVATREADNIILAIGKQAALELMMGAPTSYHALDSIEVGTGNTPPTVDDVGVEGFLTGPVQGEVVVIGSSGMKIASYAYVHADAIVSEMVSSITKITATEPGVAFSRALIDPVNVYAGDKLEMKWELKS